MKRTPPFTVAILPGLALAGTVRVLAWRADGSALVVFDAKNRNGFALNKHALITARELKEWTGVNA